MVTAAITIKKVLVLSSDPQVCHAATSALCQEFSVFASPCEERNVAAFLNKMAPDVVVCDATLVSAAASAARVIASVNRSKSEVKVPEIRVLALLGNDFERRILDIFNDGAEDYILTPILSDELRAKIQSIFAAVGSSGSAHKSRLTGHSEPTNRMNFNSVANAGPLPPPINNLESRRSRNGIPGVIGHYEIEKILGQGGYGIVYKAYDRIENRTVALKMLPKEANDQPEAVARFFRESSAISKIHHPNVVRVFDADSHNGQFFFTMEVVEGMDMKDLADDVAPFDVTRAANYVIQVAKGLAAIASHGFVHRDVKPENMILCADGTVKLIDFGLVKMLDVATITCDNDVLGTPYYMGPEYIAGGVPLDIRYDIYSLGVTFYVFLTGKYPFVGKSTAHLLERHLRDAPPHVRMENPQVPEAIDRLIVRMMAKKPQNRPTPKELVEELVSILGHRVLMPITAR